MLNVLYLFIVCVSVLKKISDDLDNDVRKDPKRIENEFKKFCKGAKGKENRFVSLKLSFILYCN